MHRITSEKIADKLIDLFADGRITHADWRLWIPRYLSDQPEVVKVNAKLLAEGIVDLTDGIPEVMTIDLNKYDRAGE
jgi:hypothetical protein